MRDVSRIVVSAALLAGVLLTARFADAVEWAEPTGIPPTANPPGFVWTRSPSDAAQSGGQFNLAGAGKLGGLIEALGGAVFGGAALDLGVGTVGQNVLFGSAKYSGLHPTGDALLLLQTGSDATPPVLTDRLRIDRDGNLATTGRVVGSQLCINGGAGADCKASWSDVVPPSIRLQDASPGTAQTGNLNVTGEGIAGALRVVSGAAYGRIWHNGTKVIINDSEVRENRGIQLDGDDLSVTGNLTVRGCVGPVFRGRTTATFQGNAGGAPGGYVQANGQCTAIGRHVCTTTEVLNSINCGAFATAGVASDTDMWIANLAPSLPTPTNDCIGWTTASPDWWGIKWRLNTTTGGGAFAERCGTSLPFACCG